MERNYRPCKRCGWTPSGELAEAGRSVLNHQQNVHNLAPLGAWDDADAARLGSWIEVSA